MCYCKNISPGSKECYENQTVITNPFTRKEVAIDNCMLSLVKMLWGIGIETIECCCGHNKTYGYIAVTEDHGDTLKSMGYRIDPRTKSPGCFIIDSLYNLNN